MDEAAEQLRDVVHTGERYSAKQFEALQMKVDDK